MSDGETSIRAAAGWASIFFTLSAAVIFSVIAAVACLMQDNRELAFGERDTVLTARQ